MPPVRMFYRGTRFVKKYFRQYLRTLFFSWDKGQVLLTDGTKAISWGTKNGKNVVPHVIQKGSWTTENMPGILVGDISGGIIERTFTKNLLKDESNENGGQYRYHGADMMFTLSFACRGWTVVEADNLADTALVWLSHHDTKDFFQQQAIKTISPPTINGSSEVYEPGVDHPMYEVNMSMDFESQWNVKTSLERRLLDIVVENLEVVAEL
jgi:hypothetical protein